MLVVGSKRCLIFGAFASLTLGLLMTVAPAAQAGEVSFVSGLYRTEKTKVDGADVGSKSTIDLGGRFSEAIDPRLYWFAEGLLTTRSYSGTGAPDNNTSLSAGGGVRYYFGRFAEFAVPYASAYGAYKDVKDVDQSTTTTQTESNGLFYGSRFGIRFGLDKDFFVDFETKIFESALFATDTSHETDAAGKTVKTSRSRTELYVNSTGAFQDVLVAIGFKF